MLPQADNLIGFFWGGVSCCPPYVLSFRKHFYTGKRATRRSFHFPCQGPLSMSKVCLCMGGSLSPSGEEGRSAGLAGGLRGACCQQRLQHEWFLPGGLDRPCCAQRLQLSMMKPQGLPPSSLPPPHPECHIHRLSKTDTEASASRLVQGQGAGL